MNKFFLFGISLVLIVIAISFVIDGQYTNVQHLGLLSSIFFVGGVVCDEIENRTKG
jgi:hypothetical protein